MADRRVVITGLGLVTPLGIGVDPHWEARRSGQSGISRISLFDPGEFDVQVAAEVKDFKPRQMVPQRKAIKVMARDVQLATAAAKLAGEAAGIEPGTVEPTRFGVVLGAGLISSDVDDLADAVVAARDESGAYDPHRFGEEGRAAMFPLWLLKHLPNMPASHISIYFDAQGPNNSITTACAAGLQALGEALHIIQRNDAEVMIAGGVDSRIKPLNLIKANAFDVLARGPEAMSRPYDARRDGMVVGEAAAILVLEEIEHARARGATPLAEIIGYGSSGGRFRVLEPADGERYDEGALRMGLASAGVEPQDLDAIFGHGVATRRSDAAEARTLRSVLGNALDDIPIVSGGGAYGHTWAAAGALAASDAALALAHGFLPPTIGCDQPDPELALDVVSGASGRETALGNVLLNSHAFGGQNACLVLRKVGE